MSTQIHANQSQADAEELVQKIGESRPEFNKRLVAAGIDSGTYDRTQIAKRQAEILRFLKSFLEPGQLTELRAPKIKRQYGKPIAVSGFYDFDHLEQMAFDAAKLSHVGQDNSPAPGVYFTINPVKPELLARRANRCDIAEGGSLTTDGDIVCRRWMLVDVDPVRPAEISSSEEEKQHAASVTKATHDHLVLELGWPRPIVIDSGNGYHLLFRIDLPANDGDVVKYALHALADRFNTDKAKIDTTVFNASRISKIPGTRSRKGDEIHGRPHRFSKVHQVPEQLTPVPTEYLQALAGEWTSKEELRKLQASEAANKISKPTKSRKRQGPKSVEAGARAYLTKVDAAVSGQSGHNATFKAACILVKGFGLSVNNALPLLAEWNDRCEPPWDESELIRKLEEAEKASGEVGYLIKDKPTASHTRRKRPPSTTTDGTLLSGPEDDGRKSDETPDDLVTNALEFENEDGNIELEPLPMIEVIGRILKATNGDIRRVGSSLFYHMAGTPDPIHRIASPDSLFGLISSVSPHGGTRMHRKFECVTKQEAMAELKRLAPEFTAIETAPHEPPISGHYYACETIEPGDGTTLSKMLGMFNPETEVDRSLLLAYIVTTIWGGECGSRPVFFFTSTEGRGAGKTTVADMLASVTGPMISFSNGESAEFMTKRLLSAEGELSRVAIVDNLKSHRFSWADFESLVTSRRISGHKLYVGEATRPNNYTWVVTTNGISLSTDIAQRAVVVRINKPKYAGDWVGDTWRFIRENRTAIIADVIAFLRGPRVELERVSRWGSWDRDIIGRLPNPVEVQRVIAERQGEADAEGEESELLIDYLRMKIHDEQSYATSERVHIPSPLMAKWYAEATGEKNVTKVSVSRIIKQAIGEGKLPQLKVNKTNAWGKGYIWQFEKLEEETEENNPVRLNLVVAIEHKLEQEEIARRLEWKRS